MEDVETMELILTQMKKSKDNKAFLANMNTGAAALDQFMNRHYGFD